MIRFINLYIQLKPQIPFWGKHLMGAATQKWAKVGVAGEKWPLRRHNIPGNVSPHPLKIASDARFPSKTCRRLY